ncbi:MAG: ComEC/Rec2 family competence protein, partial [Planctomycetaceae bacterium]
RNPGGFDVGDYLRKRQVDATLYVDHPDAVRRLGSPFFNWRRLAAEQRSRLSVFFAEYLSEKNGPIGAAMILGDRSAMPLDVRDAYVASGAMHILAISGLNVGIFAVVLMTIGRVLNFSSTTTSAVVILCVWSYAVLTDLEPPVVRAAVFLSLWATARLVWRQAALLNTVAATALILLVRDPLLLFDVGAQLSFLAVLGMAWSIRSLPSTKDRFEEIVEGRPWWRGLWRPLVSAQMMAAGVWLFTAPLIAAEFGLVSPVGVLLNVVLVPLAVVVMWTGYAFFGICLLIPQAAKPFGAVFDLGLSMVNSLVVLAGEWRFGHLFVPSPPAWWLVGFYLLLLIDLVQPALAGRRLRRQSFMLAWIGAGLVSGVVPAATNESLRVTTLDVGHGGAILVEAPNGRTLLFDCGSMEDDRWVADAVWQAIRRRGRPTLDVVVISHADLDHCNNIPALIRGGAVDTVVAARSFLDFDQPVVEAACDAARHGQVPIRLVEAGATLELDPNVEVDVLHPSDCRPGGDDNANSIVLRVTYGDRTLLLTGDLEGAGQTELFARRPEMDCDILFAPHHGGSKANTWELANWATPDAVVVSAGRRVNEKALAATYPDARLYLTPRHGAITITVRQNGWMGIETSAHTEP